MPASPGTGLEHTVAEVMRKGIRPIAYLPIFTDVGLRTERVACPDPEVAGALGAAALEGRMTRNLSSGERQRVRLASALAEGVRFAALDEPCRHLDPHHVEALRGILARRRRQGMQLAVVDRRGLLSDGDAAHDYAKGAPCRPAPRTQTLAPLDLTIPDPFLLSHRGKTRNRTQVRIPGGALVALRGPNGSGKTSLLEALARSARKNKQRIGFSRQEPEHQVFALTPAHELDEIARFHQAAPWSTEGDGPAAPSPRDLAGRFGLAPWLAKPTPQLPLGALSLLGVAIALWMGHDLVLIDEPTQGLHADEARLLADELRRCAGRGARVVVASHDPEILRAASTTWTLHDGHLATGEEGTS